MVLSTRLWVLLYLIYFLLNLSFIETVYTFYDIFNVHKKDLLRLWVDWYKSSEYRKV